MDRQKLGVYFIILALGLIISFSATRVHFDIKTIGLLVFILVFIPTLINPSIGFIAIIISMLFSPELIVGETSARAIAIRIEDVFLLVVILAWLIRVALTKDIASVFKTELTFPIFLYLGICVLSIILAAIFSEIDIGNSFFSTLKYLEYFLLFFMVRDSLKSLKQSKLFIAVFLLTALAVSIHGNIFIQESQRAGAAFFRIAPPVETRGGGEAGTLAGYLIFMMAIAAGLLLYLRPAVLKIFLACLILLMFRAFLYTLSRGSYLGFVPMVVALILFSKKYLMSYVVGILLVLMVIFMPEMVKDRITGTFTQKEDLSGTYLELEESPRYRLESWKVVLFERFPRSPVFGHGVAKYFIDGQIFLTLGEVGLTGFVVLIWILVRLFKMAKSALRTSLAGRDDFSPGLCVGFLSGLVGLLFNALGTNVFIIIRVMEPFWFIAAIVLSLPQMLEQKALAYSSQASAGEGYYGT